jgi:RecB family exonuclease
MPPAVTSERDVLIVCRTRAAQQALQRERAGARAITLDELFERLATWAALATSSTRDDVGARLFAAGVLARAAAADAATDAGPAPDGAGPGQLRATARVLPRLAVALDALRRELVHARTSARELADALGADDAIDDDAGQGRAAEVRRFVSWVGRVEAALASANVVDEALALERARQLLRAGRRPGFLGGVGRVRVELPLQATALQAAVLAALSRHVPVVVTLPVDTVPGRGALDGLDEVFRSFESDVDATNLSIEPVDVTGAGPLRPLRAALFGHDVVDKGIEVPAAVRVLPDEHAEHAFVAGAVAARRARSPGEHIVVAARNEGALPAITAALERQGVPVRRRRRTLHESPAGRLVLDVLALRLDGVPRDRLLAVLVNVARRDGVSGDVGAEILSTLRRAAARRDVEDATRPAGGYRHRLERLVLREPAARPAVERTLRALEPVLEAVGQLQRVAPLADQLRALGTVVRALVDDVGPWGGAEVVEVVARLRAAQARTGRAGSGANIDANVDADVSTDVDVDLFAVQRILQRELESQPWLDDAADVAADAVAVLTLPELCGRRFEHVVIVGCVEGELPSLSSLSSPIGDADRVWLNRALGRRALRLVDERVGGVETPSRGTGLEGAWWLTSLATSSSSLLLTASLRDARGRERATSAWLLDVVRALGREPRTFVDEGEAGAAVEVLSTPRAALVARARALRSGPAFAGRESGDGEGGLVDSVQLLAGLVDQRARWFTARGGTEDVDFAKRRAPFAFAVDGARVTRVFGNAFGLRAERPLTPTRLEALAECRMHGFVQHVLKVDVDPEPGNAIEARAAGTLAHNVLERFYRERRARRVPFSRMNEDDRARLLSLVDEEAGPLLAGGTTGHLAALAASIGFLKTTLLRVVLQLARRPPVDDVEPAAFEMQIGATQGGRAPELPAVPVMVDERRTLFIGGIIDRVDEGPGGRVVVDYKTMAGARVQQKASPSALLSSHFQLLVYLRLLEHHRPTPSTTPLHGYLVSLKDGTTSTDVGELPDLRARVVDDARQDGLGRSLGRVVLPILDGTLPPDAGARCDDCRLQRVCRVPQGRFDGGEDVEAGASPGDVEPPGRNASTGGTR